MKVTSYTIADNNVFQRQRYPVLSDERVRIAPEGIYHTIPSATQRHSTKTTFIPMHRVVEVIGEDD